MSLFKPLRTAAITFSFILVIYFLVPFLLFPLMIKSFPTPGYLANAWNIGYSWTANLDDNNWYKVKLTKMMNESCSEYPSRCQD